MAEGGIDLGDFGGEEGATTEGCEGRQGWIIEKQPPQFLPRGFGLDVGEILLGQLCTSHATNG